MQIDAPIGENTTPEASPPARVWAGARPDRAPVSGRLHIRRKVSGILLARIVFHARHDGPARMLPGLPLVVPMKAQLSQNGGDLRRLLLAEWNPNPLPDHFSQVENSGRFLLEQLNRSVAGFGAVATDSISAGVAAMADWWASLYGGGGRS